MKENGTSKLIKLLDEYDSVQYHKINHKIENGSIYRNVGETDGWHEVWRYCKSFGFIQWLVDNDKIDLENVKNIKLPIDTKLWARVDKDEKTCFDTLYTLKLLMLLSIQDNPIEFLISILKD